MTRERKLFQKQVKKWAMKTQSQRSDENGSEIWKKKHEDNQP